MAAAREELRGGFLFGIPTLLKAALLLPPVSAALSLLLRLQAFRAWRRRWWAPFGRAHYSLVTLAALGFVGFLACWNLLGLRF